MRIFTTLLLALFASLTLNAQLFVIDSPASVSGTYTNFGTKVNDGTGVEWLPGYDILDSVWCGQLALLEDGTDPINDGCEDATNVAELDGKIVVIDRGACNFSLKIYNAQVAGAIAAIIININPNEVVNMLGGDFADQVMIPAIFLTKEDGDPIRDELLNDAVVTACMGNIVFDNNISISTESILVPMHGTMPADQITEANTVLSSFTPALNVTNNGTNDATSIQADVAINFTPFGGSTSEVYTSSVDMGVIQSDSVELLVTPLAYDYSNSAPGVYEITYEVMMDSVDQNDFDNINTNNFTISENVFSKSHWDVDNNRPAQNLNVTIADGGKIEMISGFKIPNGVNHTIDSVQFQVGFTDAGTLEGITIGVNIYHWTDGVGDDAILDSVYQNSEIARVATGDITFPAGAPETAWVTVAVKDISTLVDPYEIQEDNQYFLVGTRYDGDPANSVTFGFNNAYDQNVRNDLSLFETDADLPYLQVTTWDGTGIPDLAGDGGIFNDGNGGLFLACVSHGLFVNEKTDVSTKDVLSEIDAKVELYPNPVAELLTADVTLADATDELIYNITDATGRLIYTTQVQNVTTDNAQFNVSELPIGQYFLTIQTDKGIRTETFSVNR